jgi:hypothetical protein
MQIMSRTAPILMREVDRTLRTTLAFPYHFQGKRESVALVLFHFYRNAYRTQTEACLRSCLVFLAHYPPLRRAAETKREQIVMASMADVGRTESASEVKKTKGGERRQVTVEMKKTGRGEV